MVYQGAVSSYGIQVFPSNWSGPFGYTRVVSLTGTFGLAILCFIPVGRTIPVSSKRAGTSNPVVFDLFLPMDDYTAIVDLVRNEKPIQFFFDDTSHQIGVTTAGEAVGEDQGR
jgi:hypothetical protein